MADRDHILDLHAQERSEAVPRQVGKEIPVVREIRDHETGGDKPYSGLDDSDTGSKVCMALADIDRADGLKGGFDDPGNKNDERD
jgi:hypothetical protein